MEKQLKAHWFLQQLVHGRIGHLISDAPISVVVLHDDEQIIWDEECKGLGRAPWYCGYLVPPNHPARDLLPTLNAMIAPFQARYDLGLTCR